MDTISPTDVRSARDDGRIPVGLLTGFLGAGKTTLLNRLMGRADMAGTVLLINEFGEIGIDHHLVETLDEQTVILESGCVCCTMNGDLVEALKSLHERLSRREIGPIRRVIIETTGLADPVPVVNTLMENRHVAVRYVCDGIVTVVDATLGLGQLARHDEARRQVAIADVLLLGKSDLASRDDRARLTKALARLNPAARPIEMRHGDVAPDRIFGAGLYAAERRTRSLDAWVGWSPATAHPGAARVDATAEAGGHGPAPAHPHAHAHGHAHPHDHAHDHVHDHGHGDACGCSVCDDDHGAAHDGDGIAVGGRGPHGAGVGSFVVGFDEPLPWRSFAVAMGRILARYGDRLLRVKGLVRALGDEAPVVVQCVQDNAYAPVKLARWPAEGGFADRRGALVFIGDGLGPEDEAAIRADLAALPGDTAAVQILAREPNLPTRCWLDARLPTLHRGAFETDGWVVMPRRFATSVRRAGGPG
jgi:G3E family GTPase